MTQRLRHQVHGFAGVVARLGWALLALVHVRVLAAVVARVASEGLDSASAASLAGLALALALFVLKTLDAPFLRLRTSRHALVAFVVVTALVHHDAVAPALDESAVVEITALAAGSAGAIAIVRRTRWSDRIRTSLACALTPRLRLPLCGSIARTAWPRPVAILATVAAAPRAPPRAR